MFDWFYFTPNMINIYLLLGIAIFIGGSLVKDHLKDRRTREGQEAARYSVSIDRDDDLGQENLNYKDVSLER